MPLSLAVQQQAVEQADKDLHWLKLQFDNPYPSNSNIQDGAQRVIRSVELLLDAKPERQR